MKKIIGIVGGLGPYAGLDLIKKIFDQTIARTDQEHLPINFISYPSDIPDRTDFITKQSSVNPAYPVVNIIKKLEKIGSTVIGIPCNSIHAPEIFNIIIKELKKEKSKITLLNMIDELGIFIKKYYPAIDTVGILSTSGTYKAKVYPLILKKYGINIIFPDWEIQKMVHAAIYNQKYGIKAQSHPVTNTVKEILNRSIQNLKIKNVQAIILGCTEIPLALPYKKIQDIILIDPTTVLARALIKKVAPEKLVPFEISNKQKNYLY